MSKRKIKQEGYSVLFFELFTIGKRKNGKRSSQIEVYLTSIMIGQKINQSNCTIDLGICRVFRALFFCLSEDCQRAASLDFHSLQKEFLGALPSRFEGMKRLASQRAKEITSLVDVKPFVNTQGKLLLCFVYR